MNEEPQLRVNEFGTKTWTLNGIVHRIDGPAIEYANGSKEWYQHGQLHRCNAPAIEYAIGTKMWYMNGEVHRCNGPAIEYPDGYKLWYVNGNKCACIASWAKEALQYEGKQCVNDEMIEQKIMMLMHNDLM